LTKTKEHEKEPLELHLLL